MQRARATAQSTVRGKQEIKDFDAFLCYNPADRSTVIEIGERLKERGILPWLDERELRPGLPCQHLLGQQIEQIKSAAVLKTAQRSRYGRANFEVLRLRVLDHHRKCA